MKTLELQFNAFYVATQFECPFKLKFNEDKVFIDLALNKVDGEAQLQKIIANWWKFYPNTKMIRKGNDLTIIQNNIKFTLNFEYQSLDPYKFESIKDYPSGISSEAQKAIDWAEKNGWGTCGTPVGKTRAHQLAKGEPISLDTVKRMYSFLARHKGQDADKRELGDGCGKLMWLAWGGQPALNWSERYLNKERVEKFYVFRLFVDSSNVDGLQYDTEKEELEIYFHEGEQYRYYGIDYDTFERVWKGKAACITEGETQYGSWFIGKTPSVGAALHKFLIKTGKKYEKI